MAKATAIESGASGFIPDRPSVPIIPSAVRSTAHVAAKMSGEGDDVPPRIPECDCRGYQERRQALGLTVGQQQTRHRPPIIFRDRAHTARA